tara:strand:+ start:3453 stop:5273 length:1821 start_codon:yes stop_codon:yes gene_type:complete
MLNRYIDKIFKKKYPRWTIVIFDFIAMVIILLSYNIYQIDNFITISLAFIALIPSISVVFLIILGEYNNSIRYYSLENLFRLIIAFLGSFFIILQISNFSILFDRFSIIDLIIVYYLSVSVIISFRFLIKILFRNFGTYKVENVLVYASEDLNMIINFLNQSKYFKIVGTIYDNDSKKFNSSINSYFLDHNLISIVKDFEIKKILIPELLKVEKIEFIYNLKASIDFQIVKFPEQSRFLDRLTEFSLNPLEIQDLLSRDKISLNKKNIKREYYNKRILITGGAGSIGSEIIRQLIKFKPSEILIIDNSETPMFEIRSELLLFEEDINFHFVVDSILDKNSMTHLFKKFKPEIIFHAAAFKHVSMMEENPKSAIINNILGTKNLLEVSLNSSISKFVFISSDKAVNPSSVMGVTKRICELYISKYYKEIPDIIITRFGNVLGSNGSVVKIFKDQISTGGPVTVTHPDVNRYFMTIPEASQLVLEAGAMGEKGEIFVFDMGDPVKISDLAKKMIKLSGKALDEDIKIEYIGLREGEKLYEELLTNNEKLKKSYNSLILIAEKDSVDNKTYVAIEELVEFATKGSDDLILIDKMKKIVKEYKPLNSQYI